MIGGQLAEFNIIALMVIVAVIVTIIIFICLALGYESKNPGRGFLVTFAVIILIIFLSSVFQWVGLIAALLLISLLSVFWWKR